MSVPLALYPLSCKLLRNIANCAAMALHRNNKNLANCYYINTYAASLVTLPT